MIGDFAGAESRPNRNWLCPIHATIVRLVESLAAVCIGFAVGFCIGCAPPKPPQTPATKDDAKQSGSAAEKMPQTQAGEAGAESRPQNDDKGSSVGQRSATKSEASQSGGGASGGGASGGGASGGGASRQSGPTKSEIGDARDAASALRKAKSSLESAKAARDRGDHQAAFAEALRGWGYVKDRQRESSFQGVASELLSILRTEGESMGGLPPSRKRIVFE